MGANLYMVPTTPFKSKTRGILVLFNPYPNYLLIWTLLRLLILLKDYRDILLHKSAQFFRFLRGITLSHKKTFTSSCVCKRTYQSRCGTLKCENAAIGEKVAKCEKKSTLNVKIDAICEKITLNVKKWGSLNVSNISTLNVLKSTLYVQTLFWRYLWKSNFLIENLILMPS